MNGKVWDYDQKRYVNKEEEKFTWHTGIKNLKNCPHNESIRVLLSPEVISGVQYLCVATGTGKEAVLKDTEFLVYLQGTKVDGEVYVTNLYVPGQEVSGGSVKVTEKVEVEGIVGALHKHPGSLRPAFSSTDDNCLNVNHDVSIVIPSDGVWEKWTGVGRRLVEIDGEQYYVNVKLEMRMLLPGAAREELRELLETKVKEKVHPVYQTGGYMNTGPYQGGQVDPYGRGGKGDPNITMAGRSQLGRPPKSAIEQEEVDILCPDCGKPPAPEGFDRWYCKHCKQYLNGVEDDEDDPMDPWAGFK